MARLSRRELVAGMSAAPWLSDIRLTRAMAGDPVLVLCGHYADLIRHAIEPDDYPSAHRVLLSAIADLRALQPRASARW